MKVLLTQNMDKKKVLFVSPSFHPNFNPFIQAFSQYWYHCDIAVVYKWVVENYSYITPILIPPSFMYRCMSFTNRLFKTYYIHNSFDITYCSPNFFRLFFMMKRNNPDILFIKWVQNIMTMYSVVAWLLLRKKILLHIQTDIYGDKSLKKRLFVWILTRLGVSVLSPIIWNKKKYGEKFDITFIPFVQEERKVIKKYFYDGNINIISVWKFVVRKDQKLLVQTCIHLRKKYTNLKLTLVWEKVDSVYIDSIHHLLKKNNCEDMVSFIYNIPQEELFSLYYKHDIFVLPSYNEPASISNVEAMACSLPVIVSDSNGTKCYVEEGRNGYVFTSKDLQSLEVAIEKIVIDEENIEKMWSYSYELFTREYTFTSFIQRIKKIINLI